MPDLPPLKPAISGAMNELVRKAVSSEYNLALQQARVEALPEKLRIRMGNMMLKGWIFTLVGSQLNKNDQFEDMWALSLPGSPWPALNSLHEQIKTAERHSGVDDGQ